MEKKKYYNFFWLLGRLIGFIPLIIFVLFLILDNFTFQLGNPLTDLFIFAIVLIELPIVVIGRTFGLPIETGGVAFIPFSFTMFGYILTIMFWALMGLLFAWVFDKIKNVLMKK